MLRTFSGRRASQSEYELRNLIQLLRDRGVTRYLEIGARHGDTFHEVMINLPVGSYGLAVDLPGALWGTASSVTSLQRAAADLRLRGYTIDVIIGDSTSPNIVKRVLSAAPFGAALIDGDHSYVGAKKDWLNYKASAPLIAFHDIVGDGQFEQVTRRPVEVPKLWAELKREYEGCLEFVDTQFTMGVGVCTSH